MISLLILLFSSSKVEVGQVIPPGMDFSSVVVQEDAPEVDGELATLMGGTDGSPKAIPAIWVEVSALFVKHCFRLTLVVSQLNYFCR